VPVSFLSIIQQFAGKYNQSADRVKSPSKRFAEQ